MTKTLADLLREDGAVEGDVYEACGQQYLLHDSDLDGDHTIFTRSDMPFLPAEGWKRVSPKKPLRVEFETVVDAWASSDQRSGWSIDNDELRHFEGKRVQVTVEEAGE
jgi:hypothetical protein